jgi:hypothetical protein
MKSDVNLIDSAQRLRDAPRCTTIAKDTRKRCRNPSKQLWNACRLHGAGGGAPSGLGMLVLGATHLVGATKDATPREAICSYKTLKAAVSGNRWEQLRQFQGSHFFPHVEIPG